MHIFHMMLVKLDMAFNDGTGKHLIISNKV